MVKKSAALISIVFVLLFAYWVNKEHVILHHFVHMLTLGKVLTTYTPSCDYDAVPLQTKETAYIYTKYKHCFDENGQVFTHDANHDLEKMEELLMYAVNKNCPVVIRRPFVDDMCKDRLKDVAIKRNITVRTKQNPHIFREEENWYPNLNFGDLDTGSSTKKRYEVLTDFLKDLESGPQTRITAFETSLDSDAFKYIWGTGLSFLNGKIGSTFMSHFNKTMVTTTMHNALWQSFAYQCEGHKIWKMMTPEDTLTVSRFFMVFGFMKRCDGRQDILDITVDVDVPRDSLFYFPPYWAHSVKTYKGLSILTNYRAFDLSKVFDINWRVGLHTMLGLVYYRVVFDDMDPGEVALYYMNGTYTTFTGYKRDFGENGNLKIIGFLARVKDFFFSGNVEPDQNF